MARSVVVGKRNRGGGAVSYAHLSSTGENYVYSRKPGGKSAGGGG